MRNSSTTKNLNIISFDIPYPPNYGGVIDVFFKIVELSKHNVNVHLHCFKYGNRHFSEELEKLCHKVYYYPRKICSFSIFNNIPYIVDSRQSNKLIKKLLENDFPILFEGIHSCYYLTDSRLENRKKIVRTHNVEHHYYNNLAKTENNFFIKRYFLNEAKRLKIFQDKLKYANGIAVISENDYLYFSNLYENVFKISAFHQNENVEINTNTEKYALYHGNLKVNENHNASMFLINEVFYDLPFKLIIAGNNPKPELLKVSEKYSNIEVRLNLNVEDINKMVEKAHINVLPTFQSTGIKLKLLLALYRGNHCVVNNEMIENTGLEPLCHISEDSVKMKSIIIELFDKKIDNSDIEKRKILLNEGEFSNKFNAKKLIDFIFYN